MKYILLIYASEAEFAKLGEADAAREYGKYDAFAEAMRERGLHFTGEGLKDTTSAVTVRVRGGETFTTDGPFAETHEQLGGYYVFDCATMDEAVAIATQIPGAAYGSVEIRPLMVFG